MRGLRRQYVDVIADRVRAGDLQAVFGAGLKWVGTALSPWAGGRALAGPVLGTLLVTYRCDLRCLVCDLPARAAARRRAGDRELDTQELKAVLRDMKRIGTAGVGVTGGEPMLRRDLFELLATGNRLGLHMHLNTDGFQVAERAEALVATGVRSVNVSLDGATAAVHDRARGRAGSFDRACAALGALRRIRSSPSSLRLTAVTVLTARNLHQVDAVVEVARDAGADRVGVIPVHDFGHGEPEPDPDRVRAGLARLRALHAEGVIDNSLAYLDLLPRAFRGEASPLTCYAPYSSVVVDCYGDVYPCFPMMERKEPVGRIPLAQLWRSAAYDAARRELAACRACLWNCHTELNLVMPQGATVDRRAARLATNGSGRR